MSLNEKLKKFKGIHFKLLLAKDVVLFNNIELITYNQGRLSYISDPTLQKSIS